MSPDFKNTANFSKAELEVYLCSLWKKQLKIDEVTVEDDFMKLGGQSIDLFRMLARVEADFDQEIDFDAFFETPKLSVLCDVLLSIKETAK